MNVPVHRRRDGNPVIVAYCRDCDCTTIPMRAGRCGFCNAPTTPLDADSTLLRLRRAGMTYSNIAIASRELFGWTLSENQIRHRLRELGVPANPNKIRSRTAA